MDREMVMWIILLVLCGASTVLISAVFVEMGGLKALIRLQDITIQRLADKQKPICTTSILVGEAKGVEYRTSIVIPLEHEHLVTEGEIKDALLKQLLPQLLEHTEVIAENDFIRFKKRYIGRIRVVEVK